MLKVEKTAKNLDEALELAAQELGVSKDEVSYTVTKEIGKGLMKFLVGSEIEIVAWRTADEEKEKPKAPKKAAKKEEKPKKAESTVAEEKSVPAKPEKKFEVDEDFVIPKSAVDDAKYFVSELLSKIGLTFDLHIKLDKNIINIDVSGDKMGLLIGKRGDTLDAVQMLDRTTDPAVKAELDSLRPAAPTVMPESGYYSEYIDVTVQTDAEAVYATTNGEYPSTDNDI